MAVRSAMHHAGATALSELLQFPAPATEQRTLPCACGHQASYRELRSKPVLTAVGAVKVSRPYYLCSHCLPASSRPTSNWTSKIRRPLRECAACKPLWDRTPPLTMAASK